MHIQQHLLHEIAALLNEDVANYTVFLYAETLPVGGAAAWPAVREALGGRIEVGGIKPVNAETCCAVVSACLRHGPDDRSAPLLGAHKLEQFNALQQQLQQELQSSLDEAGKIEQFWLSEGHPAHPVFWDFAFLLVGRRESLLFMGSSSD